MPTIKPNKGILSLAFTTGFLVVILSCKNEFPPEPEPPIKGVRNAELRLQPEVVSKTLNSAFTCSLQVTNAPSLLAARLHLHFNTTLMKIQGVHALDSTKVPFLEWNKYETNPQASLFIVLASPRQLPNDRTLCWMTFQALQKIGSDSLYFARSSSLTSLRDTLNREIPISHFGATKIQIGN
jgi:hypothetical protein